MDKIHISDITDIKGNLLFYLDARGDVVFIELDACANNYEATHKKINERDPGVRCVGERFFGRYAYYELYDIGHTHLYMKASRIKHLISKITGLDLQTKEFQKFNHVQKKLNECGWTTFDLS